MLKTLIEKQNKLHVKQDVDRWIIWACLAAT